MSTLAVWRTPVLSPPRVVEVTKRQSEVLTGFCFGLTCRAIGSRLGIGETSVKTHSKRLFRALGARDRAHAVALAVSGQVHIQVRSAA